MWGWMFPSQFDQFVKHEQTDLVLLQASRLVLSHWIEGDDVRNLALFQSRKQLCSAQPSAGHQNWNKNGGITDEILSLPQNMILSWASLRMCSMASWPRVS